MLIGMDGEFNLTVWQAGPALLNQRVCRIRAKKSQVREGYLRFFLPVSLKRIEDRTSCVTVKHLSAKVLNEITLPGHSLTEQQALADKFIYIEKATTLAIKNSAYLDNLIKSRFIEMFGDPVENDSKLPKCKWEDVLTIVNGKNQKKVECATGEYPICGSGGEMGRARQYLTKGDSVIIGRKGNINNPILMREPFWNVDTAFGLEPNADILRVEYLYYFCEWFDFQQLNKAVTIPSLTKADLLKIEMPLPPLPLQQEFAAFVAQVDKLRFTTDGTIEMLRNIFHALRDYNERKHHSIFKDAIMNFEFVAPFPQFQQLYRHCRDAEDLALSHK